MLPVNTLYNNKKAYINLNKFILKKGTRISPWIFYINNYNVEWYYYNNLNK